jgi:Tfp pilus assembly protein PilO
MGNSKLSLLLGTVEVALALVLGYNRLYLPQQRESRRLQAQQRDHQAHQQTEDEVAAYFQQIERYRMRLAPDPTPAWLVRELVALAEESGVQVTALNQESPQPFEQFTRLAATIQVKATYHQLGAFLDRVERAERFIRVDRVDIPQYADEAPTVAVVFSTLYAPSLFPGSGAQGR